MSQNVEAPEELWGKPFHEWPEKFNTAYFKCPLRIKIKYFAHNEHIKELAKNKEDLEKHIPLGLSHMELYKGGAGFKAIEFKL